MKLTKLQLENFRNYKKYTYEFSNDKKTTVLVGENGKGKTNLLEAIYMLSLGRSFRTLHKDELLNWEMDYFRLNAEIETQDEPASLEVFYSNYPRQQRSFKRNGVKLKNSEYLGNLITVLFYPEDLNMLYQSPSYRRRYLDILLSQVDKKYLDALSNYKKVLKQRNSLLHEIRDKRFTYKANTVPLEENLTAWDTKLVEYGAKVIKKRTELVEYLSKNLQKIYREISDKKETITIKHKTNAADAPSDDTGTMGTTFTETLTKKRESDIRTAKTSIGPHRDDLIFYINDKELSTSASRGEVRTLLLAIKLAEIKFIKDKTSFTPVLLLDDVFSELDRSRQAHLIKAIKSCQTIISTTNQEYLEKLSSEDLPMEFVKLS